MHQPASSNKIHVAESSFEERSFDSSGLKEGAAELLLYFIKLHTMQT
jgi:hypothetical protein